jgi:hypothetical protein
MDLTLLAMSCGGLCCVVLGCAKLGCSMHCVVFRNWCCCSMNFLWFVCGRELYFGVCVGSQNGRYVCQG